MKARDIQAGIDELRVLANQRLTTHYEHRRDDNGNLYVDCMDGTTYKFPVIPFRPYQLETQIKLYIEGVKRHLLSRPRRSGKEVESWNLLLQGALEKPGLYLMIYPTNVRARLVLWEGAILLPDNTSMTFLDMIPKRFVANINNQEMKIRLTNGSVIVILGSDIDPDKLRGTNPLGIVLSEFAFSDPRVMYILMPILRQNGGWLIGQSTFNGMNHFYRMIQSNKNDPLWHCRVDSIENLRDEKGNRYITDAMIEEDRKAGMPEYLIQQEYYGVVEINQETMYFSTELNNIYATDRIISGLIIPDSRVYCFYDIGWNDNAAVVMAQLDRNYDPVIVNYFEANNKTIEYYIGEARRFATKHNLVLHSNYVPHDGENKNMGSGKNVIDYGRDAGEQFYSVPRVPRKQVGIQGMRKLLYRTRFNKENTVRLIDCLSNYSKEFDDKKGIYKDEPVHNWASHGVSAYQSLMIALEKDLITNAPRDVIYYAQPM